MGSPGFWCELQQKGVGRQLKGREVECLLEGRHVAVDAAIWIFEAQKQEPRLIFTYVASVFAASKVRRFLWYFRRR